MSAVQLAGQLADERGMWAWAADDRACCSSAQQEGASAQYIGPGQAGSRPSSGISRTGPLSAALAYVRGQRGTVLVQPDDGDDAWLMGDTRHTASPSSRIQQQQQQVLQQLQRPSTVGPRQAAAAAAAAATQYRGRPFSAGPLLSGAQPRPRPYSSSRRPGLHPPSTTGRSGSPVMQRPQHSRGVVQTAPAQQHSPARGTISSGTDGLGVAELERFNSTGFARRVKGGKFSEVSREGAAAAAAAPAVTELLYEPIPEVQGHMHRAPGWSLPPNRVATSKKWARLAAQAALQ